MHKCLSDIGNRKGVFIIVLIVIMSTALNSTAQVKKSPQSAFNWSELPVLPDDFGYAGAFSGLVNNALIIAGGANFPDGGAPWTGSKKVWSDKIFVLDKPNGKWKVAGKLPQPLGYGVSVSWNDKLICIGGSNAGGHLSNVFAITYENGKIAFEKLPDLPQPLANSSGAILNNIIYVAGGLFKPESTTAAGIFWTLDLAAPAGKLKWKVLDKWPGEERMLAVSGVQKGSFFIFSGTSLQANSAGQAERKYLTDAFKFTPGEGWTKLADLPKATVAAPNPAYTGQHLNLFIFGGDDGRLAPVTAELKEKHPGFSDTILEYNTASDKWSVAGSIKIVKQKDAENNPNGSIWAPVTTNMIIWNGNLIFPGGEVRPAIRTPRILSASPKF